VNDSWSAIAAMPIPDDWRFAVRCQDGVVAETEFLSASSPLLLPRDDCARAALVAMEDYFLYADKPFVLSLAPVGTPFQQRVWRSLQAIPAGQPRSYGVLAAELGSSARAVAAACRANPIPLFIPCHRVVAAHGLGGFMGAASGTPLRLKNWLLEHEAKI